MSARAGATGSERTRDPVPACVDEGLEGLAHGAELRGADVVGRRTRVGPRRAEARVGEVGRVHELVAIAAVAEHVHRRAVSDELEEDRHDPEPAVAEDRAGSDDRDVEARGDRLVAQHLGPQLRAAVRLERPARRALR